TSGRALGFKFLKTATRVNISSLVTIFDAIDFLLAAVSGPAYGVQREGNTGAMTGRNRYVGAAMSPREARKLVFGRGSYVGDLTTPGMLHAAFVRSPHAHARIRRLD